MSHYHSVELDDFIRDRTNGGDDINGGAQKGSDNVDRPTLGEAAKHGIVGDIVDTLDPHTESDPVAILLQTLVMAGNVIGSGPYYQVEGDRHHANLFTVMVGVTSKARKGTSGSRVRSIFKLAAPEWENSKIVGGLSSGEGLINEVRDETKRWDAKSNEWETTDPGVTDKRLMVIENEFAGALRACERHGNILSPVLRNAWDHRTLSPLIKNNRQIATNPHISIVGHITTDELRRTISRTDLANGLANRFLFATVKRSKLLPFGGDLSNSDISDLGTRLAEAVEFARRVEKVGMTDEAKGIWEAGYKKLSEERAGLLGAITARAEAQAIRLGLTYALLDKTADIDGPHLRAALAVWEYCDASAAGIFGDILGDPVADEILVALRNAGPNGMSRTSIRDLFGRNQSADRIGAALRLLASKGRAHSDAIKSGDRGRPTETWFAGTTKTTLTTKIDSPDSTEHYDINDINDQNTAAAEFGRLNRFCRNPAAPTEGNSATGHHSRENGHKPADPGDGCAPGPAAAPEAHPEVSRQATEKEEGGKSWYFIVSSGDPGNQWHCDKIEIGWAKSQSEAEAARTQIIMILATKPPCVAIDCDDELEAAKLCEAKWPGERITEVLRKIRAERYH